MKKMLVLGKRMDVGTKYLEIRFPGAQATMHGIQRQAKRNAINIFKYFFIIVISNFEFR